MKPSILFILFFSLYLGGCTITLTGLPLNTVVCGNRQNYNKVFILRYIKFVKIEYKILALTSPGLLRKKL